MSDLSVESMLPDTHLTAATEIDCRGLTPSDQRRIVVHTSADMVHQVLAMRGTNPLGLVVTTELVEDASRGWPRIRVAASAPRYAASPFGL